MKIKQARAAMAHAAFCGVARQHLSELIEELAPRWEARCESARHKRRRGARRRQAGAGPRYELVFTDRLLATLVHLRTGLTHEALGVIYEVGSSTIGRAISEIRPLLAERGFAIPDRPGLRLHTLEDVFAYAAAENVILRIDGTETQVRRPRANRPGRRAFVSGKRRQNTIKTTTISDHQGRTLWSSAMRPGRIHDQTCVRTEGIAEQFRLRPSVKAEVDEGYRGLANDSASQLPTARSSASPSMRTSSRRTVVSAGKTLLGRSGSGRGADLFQHILWGVGDPLADRQQRCRPSQHRARGECEHDGQAVAHPAWITRVRHLGQPLQQARDLLGSDLRILAQLVKGRRDQRWVQI